MIGIKKGLYKYKDAETLFSVRDIINYAKAKYPTDIAYQQIENRSYESAITFRGFAEDVDALGTALIKRGAFGKHIAMVGETSVEWIISCLSVLNGVGVAVPIDAELNPETMAKQLNFSDADILICSKRLQKKLSSVLVNCPRIKTVIVLRTEETIPFPSCDEVLLFDNLLKEGKALIKSGDKSYTEAAIDENQMCQLIFTSGTTGANKGVMLTSRNLASVIRGARTLIAYKKTSISVLPVNHTYELSCHLLGALFEGMTVYINDDLKHVMQNIGHFAPEMSCMVPMMLNLIVRRTKIEAEKNGLINHLNYGLSVSKILRKVGIDKRKYFFAPVLKAFGGNLSKIICGGAPISQDVIDFMDGLGITVLNGYGITECAPLVSVNGDRMIKKNSVGYVLPVCKVRIDSPDENGNGEIQVKGENVMLGYYKMPEDTRAVFTEDGWFKTGDVGHLDKDGFLFINGRVKNLIILSNGKNVHPEEVEDILIKEIPYIKECMVHTDSQATAIYAVCSLEPDYCKANSLSSKQEKYECLMRDVKKYNSKVPTFKRIADVSITDIDLPKTSTKKIQRHKVFADIEEKEGVKVNV